MALTEAELHAYHLNILVLAASSSTNPITQPLPPKQAEPSRRRSRKDRASLPADSNAGKANPKRKSRKSEPASGAWTVQLPKSDIRIIALHSPHAQWADVSLSLSNGTLAPGKKTKGKGKGEGNKRDQDGDVGVEAGAPAPFDSSSLPPDTASPVTVSSTPSKVATGSAVEDQQTPTTKKSRKTTTKEKSSKGKEKEKAAVAFSPHFDAAVALEEEDQEEVNQLLSSDPFGPSQDSDADENTDNHPTNGSGLPPSPASGPTVVDNQTPATEKKKRKSKKDTGDTGKGEETGVTPGKTPRKRKKDEEVAVSVQHSPAAISEKKTKKPRKSKDVKLPSVFAASSTPAQPLSQGVPTQTPMEKETEKSGEVSPLVPSSQALRSSQGVVVPSQMVDTPTTKKKRKPVAAEGTTTPGKEGEGKETPKEKKAKAKKDKAPSWVVNTPA